jgi:hypothetical protein
MRTDDIRVISLLGLGLTFVGEEDHPSSRRTL